MKKNDLTGMMAKDLVAYFAKICLAQDDALLGGENDRFNRLFKEMNRVSAELKHRGDDERRALVALYQHPNVQVRLKAAKHTLAVEPLEARVQLQAIADSQWFPQAGEAGMCLALLDDGTFKPT